MLKMLVDYILNLVVMSENILNYFLNFPENVFPSIQEVNHL